VRGPGRLLSLRCGDIRVIARDLARYRVRLHGDTYERRGEHQARKRQRKRGERSNRSRAASPAPLNGAPSHARIMRYA